MRRIASLLLAVSLAHAGAPREFYGLDLPITSMVRATPGQWDAWRDSWDTQANEILVEFFHEQNLWESLAKASHVKFDPSEERGNVYLAWSRIRDENAKLRGYPFAAWHLLVWLESAWIERHSRLGGSLATAEYQAWRAHVIQEIRALHSAVEAARGVSDQFFFDLPEMRREFATMRKAREDLSEATHLRQHQDAIPAEATRKETVKDPTNGLAFRVVNEHQQEMDLWTQLYLQEKQRVRAEEGQ